MSGRPDRLSYVLVLALTLIWGASFLLIALSLRGFTPVAVASGRVLLAAIALNAVLVVSGGRLPVRAREWRWCALLGFFALALPFVLTSWAVKTVPTNTVALLIAAIPLLVLVLSRVIFRERVGPKKWVGFCVGVTGLVVLSGPSALGQLGAAGQGLGQLACLAAALSFATSALIVRSMPPIPALSATTATHVAAAAILLPAGLVNLPQGFPGWLPLGALLVLGVVQTGAAQFLRYVAVRRAGPVFVSNVGFLIPIWAGLLGVWLLDEQMTLRTALAYCLILGGVLLARSKPQRNTPETNPARTNRAGA